jgi:hypothetical protein
MVNTNNDRISFSLKGRDSTVLRAFVREHLLTEIEVDSGFILVNNYPYQIVFDDLPDGIIIMENLPMNVLISFQTLTGGMAVAVVRIIRSQMQ